MLVFMLELSGNLGPAPHRLGQTLGWCSAWQLWTSEEKHMALPDQALRWTWVASASYSHVSFSRPRQERVMLSGSPEADVSTDHVGPASSTLACQESGAMTCRVAFKCFSHTWKSLQKLVLPVQSLFLTRKLR